jgi:hypothetical protein
MRRSILAPVIFSNFGDYSIYINPLFSNPACMSEVLLAELKSFASPVSSGQSMTFVALQTNFIFCTTNHVSRLLRG